MSQYIVGVRAYATLSASVRPSRFFGYSPTDSIGHSDRLLVIDCRTTQDAAQRLTIGNFLYFERGEQAGQGLFHDPRALSAPERSVVKRYTNERGLEILTRTEFVREIFVPYVYRLDTLCVGFDLPFVLSRLAIGHSKSKSLDDAFSFVLERGKYHPRLQIKHLSRRSAIIQFATPAQSTRSLLAKRQGFASTHSRGYFVDVKTVGSALLSGNWSLDSLTKQLVQVALPKSNRAHKRVTWRTLTSLAQRTQAISDCFDVLRDRYRRWRLTRTPINLIYSEASIGKAYLRQMGVKPWREKQPAFPPEILGAIMSSYYGGRAEVHIRRRVAQVLYCDFLSMYPTVCTLMKLWQFVIAERMHWGDVTNSIRTLLQDLRLQDLQSKDFWETLTVLVQIEPEDDVLPVRAKYNGIHYAVGLNHLSSQWPLWYTLADCIASTLLTGKAPRITQAIQFRPVGIQPGLSEFEIAGKHNYRVNPRSDDFYKRLIELRQDVKFRSKLFSHSSAQELEAEQTALKICANATSYGIFIELNPRHYDRSRQVVCYGPADNPLNSRAKIAEEPGKYFHPLLGSLITGGARLMLAIAEILVKQSSLDWAFCDTDSIAIAKPQSMEKDDFIERADSVRQWFTALNPYRFKDDLLRIEDVNYELREGQLTEKRAPLYCFAVSAKRYALFNLEEGRPVIRKASAHGLGHLLPPYKTSAIPEVIPTIHAPFETLEIEQWEYDLWYLIITASLGHHPRRIPFGNLKSLEKPAVTRYAATTPQLLSWFKKYNRRRSYRKQVKPFNFLYAYQYKLRLSPTEIGSTPIAHYAPDPQRAAAACFDRESGLRIETGVLKSYRDSLNQYHLHPEDKFRGGDYTESGLTQRRFVSVVGIEYIGKEANRYEEQSLLSLDNSQICFGVGVFSISSIEKACAQFGKSRIAALSGVSIGHLSRIVKLQSDVSQKNALKLMRAIRTLEGSAVMKETAKSFIEAHKNDERINSTYA